MFIPLHRGSMLWKLNNHKSENITLSFFSYAGRGVLIFFVILNFCIHFWIKKTWNSFFNIFTIITTRIFRSSQKLILNRYTWYFLKKSPHGHYKRLGLDKISHIKRFKVKETISKKIGFLEIQLHLQVLWKVPPFFLCITVFATQLSENQQSQHFRTPELLINTFTIH